MKVAKTVMPVNPPKNFNEWAMYVFGSYAFEQSKIKNGWDKNILKLKK